MLGLILEGGASRTVYSCGILDVLLRNNIMADKIYGVSAGAAFGVSYASRQIGSVSPTFSVPGISPSLTDLPSLKPADVVA